MRKLFWLIVWAASDMMRDFANGKISRAFREDLERNRIKLQKDKSRKVLNEWRFASCDQIRRDVNRIRLDTVHQN